MIKILFVCLGNICRSPTAEGVFRHKLNQAGHRDGYLGNIFIDSAGTGAWHVGFPPDPRSQEMALKNGVNLEDMRARKITRQDFSDYDYILAMDQENVRNMQAVCPPDHHHKISLLMSYADNCPGITEVPDPYSGDLEGFERVYDIIDRASAGLLKYIQARHAL